MHSLSATEKDLYDGVWSLPGYADFAPGAHYAPAFAEMAAPAAGATVLDAGTGSGKGALALQALGLDVVAFDLSAAGLPERFDIPFYQGSLLRELPFDTGECDWVYCTDVLEHIPEAFTMLVVARLLRVAKHGLFLSISLVPDQFGVWAGRPLHLTVKDFNWWKQSLRELGTIIECRDLLTTGLFLLRRS